MPVSRQKAEDQSEIGASPPLNGHTLDRTFRAYKEYHTLCALNRKNGTSYEIDRERRRTEMLNRKYCDNLRQQQALSGRLDDSRPTQNGSGPPFETEEATTFVSASVTCTVYTCGALHACMYIHVRVDCSLFVCGDHRAS